MNIIGKKIAELRKRAGITQEELSERIGVTAQSVSKWETGVSMPDIMLLPAIADAFDVDIDTLFGRKAARILYEDTAKEARRAVLGVMQRSWPEEDEVPLEKTEKHLHERPDSQTMIIGKDGLAYVNAKIALTFMMDNAERVKLISDRSAVQFLSDMSDPAVLKILAHHMESDSIYTSTMIAKKYAMKAIDTEKALDILEKYSFVTVEQLPAENVVLKVYKPYGSRHKIGLLCAMLSLAKKLSDYKEHYCGFRG